jgi:cytochrome b involved in lipid metabolism
LFVKNSFGSASEEHGVLLTAAKVAMDDHYRAALGYPEPSAHERLRVRGGLSALAERVAARPRVIHLRSLSRTPNRVDSGKPSELGVSERSRWLPRVSEGPNAGYPEAQQPLGTPSDARQMRLPTYGWDEVRRHASADSLWIVIDGDVFDVTGFLREHPGGAGRLLEWGGQDATLAFREAPHGLLTHMLRLNYRIGCIGA